MTQQKNDSDERLSKVMEEGTTGTDVMPKHCMVFGCTNHNLKSNKKVSYHVFPGMLREEIDGLIW